LINGLHVFNNKLTSHLIILLILIIENKKKKFSDLNIIDILCLDHNEDEPMGDEMNDDSKSDQQRLSNGNRVSASTYDIHRGDDFYKKLMFYEKNSSTNNNGHHQSTVNSPRRSSFQQSLSSSSSTSANKIVNGHTSRQTQQLISRPNPSKQSSLTTNNITDRMQRSKSYKDLSDPPIVHPVYTQHTIPTNVGNGSGLIDYQQRQALPDDMSSSSTGHLPKPPPGIPSQNAR
jgi:hypothetical protein